MKIPRQSLLFLRIASDIFVLLLSLVMAVIISLGRDVGQSLDTFFMLAMILPLSWYVSSKGTNLYDEFRSRDIFFEIITVSKNILLQSAITILVIFLAKEYALSRGFVFLYVAALFVSLIVEKFILRYLLSFIREKGKNVRSVLIVGAGPVGVHFYDLIKNNPHFGYHIIGFLDDEKKSFLNGLYLGSVENLRNILDSRHVDDVIIALPNQAAEKIQSVITVAQQHTIHIRIIPDYFKFLSTKFNTSMFGPFPLVTLRDDGLNQIYWRALKRSFDILFSLGLFIFVFSWSWIIIIALQKMFNPGPVFFKAARLGRNNKIFYCYKFRSMVSESTNVDSDGHYRCTAKEDPRITKFGSFLRKSNLDELPQFFNVLKGEMSVVGPRPHDLEENLEIKDKIKSYLWRHIAKPGITGWAQVNGFRGGTSNIDLMRLRTEHDIWYIDNWSPWLDLQIIIITVWKMIKGDPFAS